MFKLRSPEVDPIPEALMAAAAAAGKLPRAAGTRGVRNTPEKIANTLNKPSSFLFNRSNRMTKLSWTKNISF